MTATLTESLYFTNSPKSLSKLCFIIPNTLNQRQPSFSKGRTVCKMRFLLVLITIVAFSGFIPMVKPGALAVLTIFKTGLNIFETGLEIVNLIKKQSTNEDVQAQLEDVRRGLEKLIQSSTTDIIREITLQNKLDRIETIVKELRSLLIDMKNYVLADVLDREDYKSLFLNRFDQRVVAMIRELPGLLAYTIPGLSEPLVDLILDKSNCNMTAIYEFQLFYADLLSDGTTLQFVFRELSNMTSADVEEFWKEKLPGVQGQFDKMEKTCKERQPGYTADEIKQNINAVTMYKNCKERYTWALCDVLYYPPMGTHQFHYHKSVPDVMFWNKKSSSGRNQIMVIGDTDETYKAWDPKTIKSALASKEDTFRSVIAGSEDSSAALKIGNAVEDFVKKKGFLIKAIIVFFDAKRLGKISQVVDKDSPGAYVNVDDVTLKYCYSSGIACTFARWDLFNFNDDWKAYTGTFHVYVYPCNSTKASDCVNHSTSAAIGVIQTSSNIGLSVVGLIFWILY